MESNIKGLAKGLIKEVIKADMSMHEAQIEAWTWMNNFRPKGKDIPKNIMEGLSKNKYLSMSEVNLELNVKPVASESFLQRLRFGLKFIFNGSSQHLFKGQSFELCKKDALDATKMQIKIKRLENGNIKAEYKPDDLMTKELLHNE